MKAQHTRGPWALNCLRYPNGGHNGPQTVYAPNGKDGGRHVCELYDNGELDANARLIAAAPDLLAACRALLLACSRMDSALTEAGRGLNLSSVPGCEGYNVLDYARAVVAKAEGGPS